MELTDANGCLTNAGLRAVAEAPPGGAPPGLAAHLAGCAKCQRRLLRGDRGVAAAPVPRRPPSPLRLALLLAALLLVFVALLWTTRLAVH